MKEHWIAQWCEADLGNNGNRLNKEKAMFCVKDWKSHHSKYNVLFGSKNFQLWRKAWCFGCGGKKKKRIASNSGSAFVLCKAFWVALKFINSSMCSFGINYNDSPDFMFSHDFGVWKKKEKEK